jgi:hypothetical protein
MNDVPEYELLSAYLDGELTAEEQVQVEQLLASDPVARQVLSDLRALSSTLQSLPQQRLNGSLSEAVLQQAEREMLAGPLPKDDRPVPEATAWWSIARRFTRPRTLVWLSLTAAVAILLSVTDPARRPEIERKELAQAPVKMEAPPEPRPRAEAPSMRALPAERGSISRESAPADAMVAATPKPQPGQALKKSKPAEAAPPPIAAPAPVQLDEPMLADKAGKEKKDARRGASPQAAEQEKKGELLARASVSSVPSAQTPPTVESPRMLAKSPSGGLAVSKAEESNAENHEQADRKDQVVRQPVLQIDCYLSVEAAQRQDLERLLTRQKMVTQSRNARLTPSNVAADRDAENSPASGEKVRVFYCEATPAQVEATLTSLAARPGELLAVSVSPTTGVGGQVPDDSSMSQFRQAPRRETAAKPSSRSVGELPASAGKTAAKESAPSATLGSAMALNVIPGELASPKAALPANKSIPKLMADIAKWTDRDQTYRFVFIVHASDAAATPSSVEKPSAP